MRGDPGHIACAAMGESSGTLAGTVASSERGAPAASVSVHCWSTDAAWRRDGWANLLTFDATTDANGRYAIAALPPGPYACYAGKDDRLHQFVVTPGASVALDMRVCSTRCPPISYRHPETQSAPPVVMRTFTAYLIFWLPPGRHYEPRGGDARYEALMARYFRDIGGTPFYNIVTQYWDYRGPIQNQVTLGGTHVDGAPYPHAGTRGDPLYDADIHAAVERAINANGWTVDEDSAFFVFTGSGVQECDGPTSDAGCTFPTKQSVYGQFDGYHSWFPSTHGPARYAFISDLGYPVYPSPNGDPIADYVLDIVSHEHFETATDPLASYGWYGGKSRDGEIGDKCEESWGRLRADGSNVTLGHGHRYLLQAEWSNAAGGCAFSY
jgi:hypothetical protein